MAKYNCIPTNVPNKNVIRKKKIATLVLLILVALQLFDNFSKKSEIMPLDNISCHYTTDNDALLSAEGSLFRPDADRSIYFHETSCRGDLTVRQLCSVESAARAHPLWQIYVLFSGPVNKTTFLLGNIHALHTLKNVNLVRVHLLEYARGTPLQSLVNEGALNRSLWRYSHTSDVLRYLTLYKWGGIYLDLDMIVVKPLTALAGNWAARESERYVACGAVSLRKDDTGRLLAANVIEDLRQNFRGDFWGQNGPKALTRVLRKICNTTAVSNMSSISCQGFEVYNQELFYPVSWEEPSLYFTKGSISTPQAYTHHLSNKFSKYLNVENGSPYQMLAKKYCPTTYKAFQHEFGHI